METTNNNTFIYNNPKLKGRCIAFSYAGSVMLKTLFKAYNMKCRVQVKRYTINDDPNDGFSPYHFYIEVKTPTGEKYIIDNCCDYSYDFYMRKFKPRGDITKVNQHLINRQVRYGEKLDIQDEIQTTIIHHFENIRKNIAPTIENWLQDSALSK